MCGDQKENYYCLDYDWWVIAISIVMKPLIILYAIDGDTRWNILKSSWPTVSLYRGGRVFVDRYIFIFT